MGRCWFPDYRVDINSATLLDRSGSLAKVDELDMRGALDATPEGFTGWIRVKPQNQ